MAAVTSTDIRRALMARYAAPAHRVFFEVGNDTGVRVSRHIDAVAVGIWPSVGHEIVGIEIKVSRGDWKRELATPAKAQSLMRFCTRWYLACPDKLVKPEELPATWGMLELGAAGTLREKVVAKLLDPEPITPGFMAAVLRNANAVDMELVSRLVSEHVEAETKRREKRFGEEVERGVERKVREVSSRTKRAEDIALKLEKLTGQDFLKWEFDPQALAAAYRLINSSGLHTTYTWGMETVPGIVRGLEDAATKLKTIFDDPAVKALLVDPAISEAT